MTQDIRWRQRFQNFEKAYTMLLTALEIPNPSVVERAGIIQFYEVAFELAWKTLKDYLQQEGFDVNSPRQAIKQAFQSNVITDGHLWIAALEDRNLTVHTYDESKAVQIENSIRTIYTPLLMAMTKYFKAV